jgi:drug/metabolite transporter (DMT)-like permease
MKGRHVNPLVLLLVLGAAGIHVVWNFSTKSSKNKPAFLWFTNSIFAVVGLPFYLLLDYPFDWPWQGWCLILASGLLHAIYYRVLGQAYEMGDLSLVYPLARGTSVFIVAALSFPVFGEVISGVGFSGIAVVLLGIYILHMKSGTRRNPLIPAHSPGAILALYSGVLIAAFSFVDKAGIKFVDPLPFLYLIFTVAAIFYTPMAFRGGISPIRDYWRNNRAQLVMIGLVVPCAYGLILAAFTLAPAAYVVTSREIRLVLGAVAGTLILKEKNATYRISGSILIVLGIILLVFAK